MIRPLTPYKPAKTVKGFPGSRSAQAGLVNTRGPFLRTLKVSLPLSKQQVSSGLRGYMLGPPLAHSPRGTPSALLRGSAPPWRALRPAHPLPVDSPGRGGARLCLIGRSVCQSEARRPQLAGFPHGGVTPLERIRAERQARGAVSQCVAGGFSRWFAQRR